MIRVKKYFYLNQVFYLCLFLLINNYCSADNKNLERAEQTLEAVYKNYGVQNTCLLRETYPFDDRYNADYLASGEQAGHSKPYAYLWPYSGTLSALSALYEKTGEEKYADLLKNTLTGLDEYFDRKRLPPAYASYINSAPKSDRFYDDNVWLVIDFVDIYLKNRDKHYLERAETTWKFVLSGWDDKLSGGIYWTEQKKTSKNTCSNAPAAVAAMKLFKATDNEEYLAWAIRIYAWTKTNLEDTVDYLYFDNKKLDGQVDKAKYSYNSGQMLQAAVLLYSQTENESYLIDARNLAKSCHRHFFRDFDAPETGKFKLLKKGNVWFNAVMLRGFIELYRIDKNRSYLDDFQRTLDYAWEHARNETGLFNQDMSGKTKDKNNWLLTQAAMVEMFARLSSVNH